MGISLSDLVMLLPFGMLSMGVVVAIASLIVHAKRKREEKRVERLRVQREAWLAKGGFDGD